MVDKDQSLLSDGIRIRTTGPNPSFENALPNPMRAARRWGVYGTITGYSNRESFYYRIRHDDETGAGYDSSEFEVLEVQASDLSPLRLTRADWWQELEKLRTTYGLPTPLVDCMKSLVSAHLTSTIPPEATPHLVRLAKEHLSGGVLLSDSDSDNLYAVMVWVPDPGKEEGKMSRFWLVRAWPDGKLRNLTDLL
jgi:hypothetical protein